MIFYFISPIGASSPGLYETFIPTFEAKGHRITNNIHEAEIACFDSHSGYLPYNTDVLETVLAKGLTVVWLDAFDYHGNSTKNWFGYNAQVNYDSDGEIIKDWMWFYLQLLCRPQKIIYFMRKIQTDNRFPHWIYPFEYVQFPDHDFQLTTAEELQSRPYDIFFVGNTSRQRRNVCSKLAEHFKCDFELGMPRIPHDEWLQRGRQSKLFLTSDGGGISDERPYQLITIAPMLKQKNNQLQVHPFTNFNECMEVSEIPTEIEIENLKGILSSKWNLYHIYENGVNHMKKYYSPEARAKYVLNTILNNL